MLLSTIELELLKDPMACIIVMMASQYHGMNMLLHLVLAGRYLDCLVLTFYLALYLDVYSLEPLITSMQLHYQGNKSTGDNFDGVPNIDHTQPFVRKDIIEWLIWLRKSVGFQDFRFDFTKG
jgi:hypothetical protein